jgi:arsenate reductase-like glutaredoxin family protein
VTCQKTQEFLETAGGSVSETVDGKKIKFSPAEALALLDKVKVLIAARGKKVVRFDLVKARPDDETLLSHLIGPSGNLRAPAAIVGKTLFVGFNSEAYQQFLGD